MRCRKVRSLLSAISFRDEVPNRQSLAVREHLSTCPDCRKEASLLESLKQGGQQMPHLVVSDDFNVKLLNRVAKARFNETRTRAYLPKNAPLIRWNRVVPVLVTAALALTAVSMGDFSLPGATEPIQLASVNSELNNDYLTAQPVDNPNLTSGLHNNWSFQEQFRNSERITTLSHNLLNGGNFVPAGLTGNFGTLTSATYDGSVPVVRLRQITPRRHVFRVVASPTRNGGTTIY